MQAATQVPLWGTLCTSGIGTRCHVGGQARKPLIPAWEGGMGGKDHVCIGDFEEAWGWDERRWVPRTFEVERKE